MLKSIKRKIRIYLCSKYFLNCKICLLLQITQCVMIMVNSKLTNCLIVDLIFKINKTKRLQFLRKEMIWNFFVQILRSLLSGETLEIFTGRLSFISYTCFLKFSSLINWMLLIQSSKIVFIYFCSFDFLHLLIITICCFITFISNLHLFNIYKRFVPDIFHALLFISFQI